MSPLLATWATAALNSSTVTRELFWLSVIWGMDYSLNFGHAPESVTKYACCKLCECTIWGLAYALRMHIRIYISKVPDFFFLSKSATSVHYDDIQQLFFLNGFFANWFTSTGVTANTLFIRKSSTRCLYTICTVNEINQFFFMISCSPSANEHRYTSSSFTKCIAHTPELKETMFILL